tara:strand:- start:1724 stop:2518 length:795 start_codon:yes stop_codon:yes gene_type:complete
MQEELELSLKIQNESPRLSLVILDNLVELKLFEIIQSNAMFDYLDNSKVTAKKRINLYSYFDEKLKYALNKDIITKEFSELLKLLHSLRNQLYHTGRKLNVTNRLSQFYYDLLSVFILDKSESKFDYKNENKISLDLKTDLNSRFEKLKKNIRISSLSWESEGIPLSDEEINDNLDHIFSNYGEHIVEKCQLKKELKVKYISQFLENQVAENSFFQIERLYELSSEVESYNWEDDLSSLKKWFTIDKEISFYEEVIEWYILIAC